MSRLSEQKLIDIMCEAVNMAAGDINLQYMDIEDRMEWLRRQLEFCGYPTEPVGASWARLIPPQE